MNPNDFEQQVADVMRAWSDQGMHPLAHRREKLVLQRRWPVLYRALTQLCEEA